MRYLSAMTYWKLERPSRSSGKKWKVRVPTTSGRGRTVTFGDASMEDYTIHKDKARRDDYRTRHQHDHIDNPYKAGFWSWWSLWGASPDLSKAHAVAVAKAKKILGARREGDNEIATSSAAAQLEARANPAGPPSEPPTMADVSPIVAALDVPKRLRAEFLQGFAVEWERAGTVDYDLMLVGKIVLDHLLEDEHYYRKLRRARLNPTLETGPSNRVQACFDALLSLVQEQYPDLVCTIEVDEAAGQRGGEACNRAYAFCEDLEDGSFRIGVAHKLNDADDSRVEGLLRHELAHAVLLHGGDLEHTERDADEVAEALFGSPLFYDAEDVQTTDPSAPGARRPRPEHLDDASGRTLDEARTNPYPTGTMHQLETVEDVESCLDDCAARGDAKTPRMLASQFSQQAKELAGGQARMMLSLAKACRHCANAVEARLAGEVDRAMSCERLCERAIGEAQGGGSGRSNPEWAKSLGRGLYKGARYAGESARDLYQGAREAHASYDAPADERQNPEWAKKLGKLAGAPRRAKERAAAAAVVQREKAAQRAAASKAAWDAKKARAREYYSEVKRDFSEGLRSNPRLPGIGTLTIRPASDGGRDHASVEVTKAFVEEWDHDMLNRAPLMRDVMAAAERHRGRSNFYAVSLKHRGREFAKAYPSAGR